MPNYNRVILAGHLTRDVYLRYAASGSSFATFGLAVTTKSREKTSTLFIDVTVFGRTAEVASEFLAKGKPVLVDGRLQTEEWQDKETGVKRTKISMICDSLQLLGSRGETHSDDNTSEVTETPF